MTPDQERGVVISMARHRAARAAAADCARYVRLIARDGVIVDEAPRPIPEPERLPARSIVLAPVVGLAIWVFLMVLL